MKKILSIFAISALIFSCKSNNDVNQAKQETLDSLKNAEIAKQAVIDSMNRVKARAVANEKAKTVRYEYLNEGTGGSSYEGDNTPATTERKGMSRTAKGALIGAGVGAVTGAVVSKKKGKGALIGGLIGAGAGAVVGNATDKKKKQ